MKKEPPWQITIRRAQNGFVLFYPHQLDDGTVRIEHIAIDERDSEADAAERLLWEIINYFSLENVKVVHPNTEEA